MRCLLSFAVAALPAVILIAHSDVSAQEKQKPLRLSIAKTFARDQSQVFADLVVSEFKIVVKDTTGLDGDAAIKFDPAELAAKLNNRELDFGIVHAHEFAWVQKKYPDLQPLLIAATKNADKRVCLIVPEDSPAKSFADLRGKKIDWPRGTKEYCRIHVHKLCADRGEADPKKYFGTIAKSATQFDALDEVARRKADATVIDTIWLDSYKDFKGPVFAKHLRILERSSVVPPAVVLYKKGALPQATIDKVHDGLRKAHTTARGRLLLMLWHIDSFEAVPKDYAKSLSEVLKEYPAPEMP
jgi:ABC-type phosphate/phosphonate transport system substrate-binding protein